MLINPEINSWDALLKTLNIHPEKIQNADLKALKNWCHQNIASSVKLKDYYQIKGLFDSYLKLNSKLKLSDVMDPKSPYKYTVVQKAAELGFDRFLELCLQECEESTKRTLLNEGIATPLHLAALNGRLQALEVLLDEGADPNRPNKANLLPIHNAATVKQDADQKEKIACVLLLLSATKAEKWSADATKDKRFSLLTLLVGLADDLPIIEKVLKINNRLIECTDSQGRNPLHIALINNRTHLIPYFMAIETLITETNNHSNIAHLACKHADEASINLVLSQYPDLFHKMDNDFLTPVYYLEQRKGFSQELLNKVHQIPNPRPPTLR